MVRLIYTAMSGAKQIFLQQAGVAQNLANAATVGYRAMENRFRAVPVLGSGALGARLMTSAWHQGRATVAGQGGFHTFFESVVRDDPTVRDLLDPFRRRPKAAIA